MSFLEKSLGLRIRTNAIHRFLCSSVILWQLFHRHSSTRWPTLLVIKVKFLQGKLLWSWHTHKCNSQISLLFCNNAATFPYDIRRLVKLHFLQSTQNFQFLERFLGLGTRPNAIPSFLCSSVILCSLFHTICKYLLAFISCEINFYFCSRQHAKRKNFHQKPTGMIATRKEILTGHFKLASRYNLTYWWWNRKLAEGTRYKKPYFQVKTEHVLDWPEFIVCCEVC